MRSETYEMREETLLLRKAQAYTVNLYAQTYQRLMGKRPSCRWESAARLHLREAGIQTKWGLIVAKNMNCNSLKFIF